MAPGLTCSDETSAKTAFSKTRLHRSLRPTCSALGDFQVQTKSTGDQWRAGPSNLNPKQPGLSERLVQIKKKYKRAGSLDAGTRLQGRGFPTRKMVCLLEARVRRSTENAPGIDGFNAPQPGQALVQQVINKKARRLAVPEGQSSLRAPCGWLWPKGLAPSLRARAVGELRLVPGPSLQLTRLVFQKRDTHLQSQTHSGNDSSKLAPRL